MKEFENLVYLNFKSRQAGLRRVQGCQSESLAALKIGANGKSAPNLHSFLKNRSINISLIKSKLELPMACFLARNAPIFILNCPDFAPISTTFQLLRFLFGLTKDSAANQPKTQSQATRIKRSEFDPIFVEILKILKTIPAILNLKSR